MTLAFDLDSFDTGSPAHLFAVAMCLLAMIVWCWLGRRWRKHRPIAESRFRLCWAIVIALTQMFSIVWWLWPSHFDLRISLPLQMCDFIGILAAVVMVTRWRWVWTLVYFDGWSLAIFAFIMPTLKLGPGHVEFYLFWLTHLEIIGSAVYLVVVRDYRPNWRDWRFAVGCVTIYFALIVPLNIWLDTYYGYVGPATSAADVLGPWPIRVAVMFVLQVVALTLLLAPWEIVMRIAKPQAAKE